MLTEEVVTIPPEGLVNVSGFHVDPGWSGSLIFAVFNAGPATIHLQRGIQLFLLWIADLDEASEKRKEKPGHRGIPSMMINNINGVVDSVYALEKRVKDELKAFRDNDEELRNELNKLEGRQSRILTYFAIAAVFGGALVGAVTKAGGDYLFPPRPPAISAAVPACGGLPSLPQPTVQPPAKPTAP